MGERIQIDYRPRKIYTSEYINVIGATTNTTLRTVTAYNDTNCLHVRKFGIDYTALDFTNVTKVTDTGAGETLTFEFFGKTSGTSLGSITDNAGAVGAFVDGSTLSSSEGIRLRITCTSGAGVTIADGRQITITSDVDSGGYVFYVGAETLDNGEYIDLYLAYSGATYYDSSLMYGGYRIPEANQGPERTPFYDPKRAAADPNGSGYTIVTVLDSATYDMQFTISTANMVLQAALGQTPTITSGIGARITREISLADGSAAADCFDNNNAIFVNENGNDGTANADLSWQYPYSTVAAAMAAIGAKSYIIYGGTGATIESGIFAENITLASAITLESEYGYIMTIQKTSGSLITITNINANVYGIICDAVSFYNSGTNGIYVNVASHVGNVKNCTFTQIINGIKNQDSTATTVSNCYFYYCDEGILYDISGSTFSGIIENCIFDYGKTDGIYIYANTISGTIKNCIITNCGSDSMFIAVTNFSGTIENCTWYHNNIGLSFAACTNFTGSVRNHIIQGSYTTGGVTGYDLYKYSNNATITESDYGTNAPAANDWTIGAGCITTDPEFIKITYPYILGISADSPCYRTDTSSDDMGAHLRIIEINEDDVEINGFIIDGNSQYNNAIYIADSANHTGTIIKWCSIYDFQGIAIDLYDDNTALTATISNNKIYNNGNGIKLSYGGNTLDENLIYNNYLYGLYINRTNNIINHCVFFGNYHGLYLESSFEGIIKNSIFYYNSLYGIFSDVSVLIYYCCIVDSINSNVNITDSSNIIENPLFINVNDGEEDFYLKSIELGYTFDSPCLNVANDNYDMGAYKRKITQNLIEYYWRKYVLEHNPLNMNETQLLLGKIEFEDSFGNLSNWIKTDKIELSLKWSSNTATSKEQRLKIRYFQTLVPSRINEFTSDECEFRIKLLPQASYGSGIATIDATTKTLTDSDEEWIENEKKGWHVTIIYEMKTGGYYDSATKSMTKSHANWDIDEWIGYYLFYNGYYYYIKSNSDNTLILSDPENTLIDADNKVYKICKYFKIESNESNYLTLTDNDSELIDGIYDYFIDFILCRVQVSKFSYSQRVFDYSKDFTKGGYSITFQEID